MANLLAHSLFALALYSFLWSIFLHEPLTEYAFLAAIVALMPDIDAGAGGERSPLCHSLGYAVLWSLLALCGLGLASSLRLMPLGILLPMELAVVMGLGSHLLLDALVDPGVLTLPKGGGEWGRFPRLFGVRVASRLNLLVSLGSTAALLTLLALY
ncbi:MAG: hypothetical protein ACE5HJ_02035 [Thermoplasmata archaeon]